MNIRNPATRKNQQGAVLIATLMILLLMTIFGISAMGTNILEEKMASNMRERNTAFQAAETALRACEGYVSNLLTLPDPSNIGSTSIWSYKAADPTDTNNLPWWKEKEWGQVNWENYAAISGDPGPVITLDEVGTSLPGMPQEPMCLIEKLPPVQESVEAGKPVTDAKIYLQITARGVSVSGKSVVMLQSVYKW
jgi:type IV pilus assembly protein PilX